MKFLKKKKKMTTPIVSKSQFNPADFVSDEILTENQIIELNRHLDNTKVLLFQQRWNGFLGPLVASISFLWEPGIDTAVTNGVFMAWNPKFYMALDRDTRVTVLAHEAWHIAFQHMDRCGNRDPQIWNIAADFVINNMLKSAGYFMDGFPFLLDPQYAGMTTEEVYDKLLLQANLPHNPQDGDFCEPGSGPASMQGGMTPKQIQSKAFANVHNASTAHKMAKGIGDLPGEVQQMIDDFLRPKLPWQEILYNFFDVLARIDFSYKSPNRRYTDPLLPGKAGISGLSLIHYYLDISGSISDQEIKRFNSEVKYIKETFNPEKLVLVTFDTVLNDFYEFEEDDEFERIIITGRGGTDLREVWEHAKTHMPDAMVVFTDLHVGIPPEPPGPPLIWICSGNPKATVPYGTKIDIKAE